MISFELGSEFLSEELIPLPLADVKYGYDRGWLRAEAVVSWAIAQLQDQDEDPLILALASVDPSDTIRLKELLDQTQDQADQGTELSERKWLYLELKAAFRSRNNLEDPLGVVEHIYADFGYPPALESFVRYMPLEPGDEPGEDALIRRWAEFLRAENSALRRGAAPRDAE